MTRRFIDTHCHFDFPPFTGNEGSALDLAAQAGVEKIIVPAVDETRFGIVLDLAARYPALYAALGLHPIVIENHTEAALAELERRLVQRPEKLVAIGEIGLDLYREDPQFDRQEWFLDRQLQLAKRYDLPVILHSRRT
ncbi:MAG TPA: metal-dependent hydrolase, partial [Atlantibacter hermannii]|nr:metal-dependent hydrolase [Atlantibacter hermannii]